MDEDLQQAVAALGGTGAGAEAVRRLLADPEHALIGLDFDGTLSPIVADPEQAFVLPAAVEEIVRLARRIPIAIITGRPVRTALRLGGFADREGLEGLVICGQYGVERWDARTGRISEPAVPEQVTELKRVLPGRLDELGLGGLYLEDKGRAVAVHTRRCADPAAAMARVEPLVTELVAGTGLHLEPGRNVLEIRAPGRDKGSTLRGLVDELGTRSVVYAGDDLGDLPAFDTVIELRAEGTPGLLIGAASTEQDALATRADLTVDGPEGVAGWLHRLAAVLER